MVDITVLVAPHPGTAGDLSGRPLAERLGDRIDELGDAMLEIVMRLRERVSGAMEGDELGGLQEVQMVFSLDLQAEAGVVITRASTTAGFQMSLTWARRD